MLDAGFRQMHKEVDSTVGLHLTSGPLCFHSCLEECMGCYLRPCLFLTYFDFKAEERN